MNQILKELGVKETNLGACIGGDDWIDNSDSNFIESFNPTNGKLIVKCSDYYNKILIYNSIGNQVLSFYNEGLKNREAIIDLSSYSKGVYFIQIEVYNELIKQKIILQ